MAHIVVVDDETELASAIAARLRSDGHSVDIAEDGPGAVEMILATAPDLVILDLMLPGFDGLEVCRRIQHERSIPVIMLTARGSETDRVVGLELGADDYMAKPFSMRELAARVRALLRRIDGPKSDQDAIIRVASVEVDTACRRVRSGGDLVRLTATEFDLLAYLLASPGVVRTRHELLVEVWGYRDGSGPRTVDSHVRAVRRKVGAEIIRTIHGIGYAGCDGTEG
ncbi:MAG: response regulator transcription factor [Lacisediminihabitans sp.]